MSSAVSKFQRLCFIGKRRRILESENCEKGKKFSKFSGLRGRGFLFHMSILTVLDKLANSFWCNIFDIIPAQTAWGVRPRASKRRTRVRVRPAVAMSVRILSWCLRSPGQWFDSTSGLFLSLLAIFLLIALGDKLFVVLVRFERYLFSGKV